jgi:hypothetical protein
MAIRFCGLPWFAHVCLGPTNLCYHMKPFHRGCQRQWRTVCIRSAMFETSFNQLLIVCWLKAQESPVGQWDDSMTDHDHEQLFIAAPVLAPCVSSKGGRSRAEGGCLEAGWPFAYGIVEATLCPPLLQWIVPTTKSTYACLSSMRVCKHSCVQPCVYVCALIPAWAFVFLCAYG